MWVERADRQHEGCGRRRRRGNRRPERTRAPNKGGDARLGGRLGRLARVPTARATRGGEDNPDAYRRRRNRRQSVIRRRPTRSCVVRCPVALPTAGRPVVRARRRRHDNVFADAVADFPDRHVQKGE